MQSKSPDSSSPTPETDTAPTWRREHNPLALVIVLIIHILVLAVVLLSRWRPPPKPELNESVVVFMPTAPQKKIPDPVPVEVKIPPPLTPPQMPEIKVPELPTLDFKPDAIRAPVAPPPPPPVAAPAPPPPPPPPPVPAPAAVASTKLFIECADTPNRKMVADVYQLSLSARSVKAMDKRKPIKRVCMAQLDIPPSDFTSGFPGIEDLTGFFGLDIRFTVTLPVDTDRDIMLLSDDGGVLYIDDVLVIDNDGFHGADALMETVHLKKGVHNFRVRYFQGPPPGLSLMLAWKREGAPMKDYVAIPQRFLGRPPAELLVEIPAAAK